MRKRTQFNGLWQSTATGVIRCAVSFDDMKAMLRHALFEEGE